MEIKVQKENGNSRYDVKKKSFLRPQCKIAVNNQKKNLASSRKEYFPYLLDQKRKIWQNNQVSKRFERCSYYGIITILIATETLSCSILFWIKYVPDLAVFLNQFCGGLLFVFSHLKKMLWPYCATLNECRSLSKVYYSKLHPFVSFSMLF